ncbi:MAG: MarR family winged helix-turn-helix transcriptional regulator [Trueperaceae bacterium]
MPNESLPNASVVGFSLFRLAEYFNDHFIQKLLEQGVTDIRASHLTVFRELQEGGSRVTAMASRAGITKQSMSALVEHLEERGYVERIPDPKDGRAHLIRLSKKGRQIYDFGMQVGREIDAIWEKHLGKKNLMQLRTLLHKLDQGILSEDKK